MAVWDGRMARYDNNSYEQSASELKVVLAGPGAEIGVVMTFCRAPLLFAAFLAIAPATLEAQQVSDRFATVRIGAPGAAQLAAIHEAAVVQAAATGGGATSFCAPWPHPPSPEQ